MADVYVFASNATDFSTMGLCGALLPTSCIFEEELNGLCEITLEHPLDSDGRYLNLARGNMLVASVPVRTTPEISSGSIVTSVETWTVKASATSSERGMYSKDSGGNRLRTLDAGLSVTVTRHGANRYKIKTGKYGTGWIDPNALHYETTQTIADNSQSIEAVATAWTVKPQIFRIYNVEKGLTGVTAYARHISYDLLGNLTTYANSETVGAQAILDGILNGCIAAHDFKAYTNIADTRTGVGWTRVSPISALLDSETGFVAKIESGIVRDNYELFFLRDAGMNRGVVVQYGKNMTGIEYTDSDEDVVTRIIPVGENKDGSDLLLDGTVYIDSEHINDYPVPHCIELKCSDCKVGANNVTTAIARQRMREQAQAKFTAGCDVPQVSLSVDFVNLGDTAEYSAFRNLENLFLWDYVTIRMSKHNIDVTARVAGIVWDCVLGRMQSMRVGNVGKTLNNTGIGTWQIPSGFSGSKIASGTVDSAQLGSDIINARHVQSESINTQALQAESVTTNKLAAQAVTADKIAAGAVNADKIAANVIETKALSAVIARLEEIAAGSVTTDDLYAAFADVSDLHADTAGISYANIKDLVSGTAIITTGQANELYIARLSVTAANMVSLSVGKLLLQGTDGNMYQLTVDDSGNVSTVLRQISNSDIADGTIDAGEKILSGSITADQLNVQSIFASSALINAIKASNIDTADLFANNAFINSLNAWNIWSNDYMQLSVKKSDLETYLRLTSEGVVIGKTSDPVRMVLTNSNLQIQENGNALAIFGSSKLNIPRGEFTNALLLGNFAFSPQADGGLTLLVK